MHNNFAGPQQVKTGGKPSKREPWAHALSGKTWHFTLLFTQNNVAGPQQVKTGGKPSKREPCAHALPGKKKQQQRRQPADASTATRC
eukprot:7352756-Pyramimonas_sp.AAC.1